MRYLIRLEPPSGLNHVDLARTDWEGSAYQIARDVMCPLYAAECRVLVIDTRRKCAVLYTLSGTLDLTEAA